ncbi:MAG: ABC transporter ATP-binding protein [Syntrophomonadaceae bacterium]|nr:ABC transporter ATP-binding protein [Syntrophomonadaceae bacterium]
MFNTLKIIFNWVGPYKKRLYLGFVYSFLVSIFTSMPIMVAIYTLSRVIADWRGEIKLQPNFIWFILFALVVLVLLRFLFSYLRAKTQESIGYEVAAEQRIRIGGILKRVPMGYFSRYNLGDISAAVTTELSVLELRGIKMIDIVVNGYINVLATILFLAIFNFYAALISAVGILLSALFLREISKKSKKNEPVSRKAQVDMIASTIEYIRGMAAVKAFNQEGVSIERVKKAYRDSKEVNIQIQKGYALFNCLHLLALKSASVLIVLVTAWLVLGGQMGLPVVLMMAMFSFTIFVHLEAMDVAAHELVIIDSTLSKLKKIEQAEFIDQEGKNIPIHSYEIQFDNVSFGYDTRDVIKSVSFLIPQYTTTAIVGPSGSGKTTICNLIARFYDVNAGSVKIGGRDVREFTLDSLLANISMVFQSVYLFQDTVKNNIGFGKPGASDEEIMSAAKAAQCHDFIVELPNGYDTVIGEGGSSLSGGEKQRISIARAILKNAPIVILDEATASVDPENEHYIQEAISALTRGKTVIIIAHRLATIQHVDQILVIDNGRVAQKGNHEELIGQEGIYKRFLAIRQAAEAWNI